MKKYEQLKKERDELSKIQSKLLNKYGIFPLELQEKISEYNNQIYTILVGEVIQNG